MDGSVSIYDYVVKTAGGEEQPLKTYEGSALLIVNTASQCGFTPQYQGLQDLYRTYHEQGLAIIAFPCNQFGQQEPGTDDEIQEFCQVNYGVEFPVYAKVEVNGDSAAPVYDYLTSLEPAGPIQWNFTKFLFDRTGQFVGRYEPRVTPEDLKEVLEKTL